MEYMALFLIGLIAGTFGSLFGVGGGIIVVPSLLFLNSLNLFDPAIRSQNAVGISLMVMIFTAISSTLYNIKGKRVDINSGLTFFMASGPASVIGAMINESLPIKSFYILFGLLMVLITYLLAKQKKMKPKQVKWTVNREYIDLKGNRHEYGYNRTVGFLIPAFAGLLAGLFGIGGGIILVPMMVLLFRFPPHVATATSMFIILLSASIGSISHILLGNVIYSYVLAIAPGAYLGGKLGSYFATKLSSQSLILAFRIFILLIAIQMIYKGL
ncbi:sulfite exporter TauE/SafE family protein [Tepidibacillus sp. HK-1]|uniref:sulfite exporter TauE/SafE family protein n=1 Tax=Tepidibacillus sp. HK-1 TaxID=1883407 RepID=UPI00085298AE|nr:sulfite exporter TauE/SafE family protein [Tepidibacillus sp. HK-1]GBF10235.1 sulfite exporter TauE/SafE [Tepidibacillus sp. HK-1]